MILATAQGGEDCHPEDHNKRGDEATVRLVLDVTEASIHALLPFPSFPGKRMLECICFLALKYRFVFWFLLITPGFLLPGILLSWVWLMDPRLHAFLPLPVHPVVTVASWRSRTASKNRPLHGIHACFRNPLVLFLKHFLVERWRDLVLQNTDIVFTYAGKTKITVRSETHPTEQSRCLP